MICGRGIAIFEQEQVSKDLRFVEEAIDTVLWLSHRAI